MHEQPTSFLRVKIDGRSTYFEWINAARYVCGNDRGTMALVSKSLMSQVWFGFSPERFLIRLDTTGGPAREQLASVDRLRIGFVDPPDWEIIVEQPAAPRPLAYIRHGGELSSNGATVETATDRILELGVPFGRLGLKANDPIRFYVELLAGEASLDRRRARGFLN